MTLAQSTLTDLDAQVAQLKAEREVLLVQQAALSEKLVANMTALRATAEQAEELRFADQLAQGQFDWAALLAVDGLEAKYKVKDRALLQLFPEEYVTADGYCPETKQSMLQLRFDTQSADLLDDIAHKLVTQLLPVLKPVSGRGYDGGRVMSLMEPGLSAYGSHYLCVFDDHVELRVMRYSSPRMLHSTATLLDMLQYLQEQYAFGVDKESGDAE